MAYPARCPRCKSVVMVDMDTDGIAMCQCGLWFVLVWRRISTVVRL